MLAGRGTSANAAAAAMSTFKGTSVYDSAAAAAGKRWRRAERSPSYLSAKAFADGVIEMCIPPAASPGDPPPANFFSSLPPGVQARLRPILIETRGDALAVKAGLEKWFDDTMDRLEGSYKRWAALFLFFIGLALAGFANASTFDVAERLYRDSATRQAVVQAAGNVTTSDASGIKSVADATDKLKALGFPVGWDKAARDSFSHAWHHQKLTLFGSSFFGWIVTALLIMLGAPF